MTSKSRASRRQAAREQRDKPSSRWLLPAAGLAIALVALVAIVLSQGGSAPAASPAPSAVVTEPVITGEPLPVFAQSIGDPAKGLVAPVVSGADYQGQPVDIAPNGKVTMVIFLAHWCSHCQDEVPLIQDWVDAGRVPADVDLVSVSTGISSTLPNYPPEAWLQREGWTVPVIVDPSDTVAAAYGLKGTPYFVILDGTGKVFARLAGEVPVSDLEQVLAAVPRS